MEENEMIKRGRRLRASETIRDLVRENTLSSNDFIYPIFVVEGENIKKEISSLPGNFHYSVDKLDELVKEIEDSKVKGIMIFGIPDHKDECGSSAYDDDGIVQKAIKKVKELNNNILVITDVCMCEYTSHGHCGIIRNGDVENDETLEYLAKISLSHAKAGADMIAPSDMMDGRIAKIREALDKGGFKHIPIMAYSAKYCSAFYGPFREAANSAPEFGDRKTYQMDPGNLNEAIREIEQDIEEGADIVMVKPALSYLDVIRKARDTFNYPIAAYNVSGEYAMIKAAANMGWLDEKRSALEMLLSMKRAGADIIITYYAIEASNWINNK
jgi:Delta-aminolevulinic acid dehydratase